MDKRADKSDLRETDKGSLLVVFNNYDNRLKFKHHRCMIEK